MIDWMKLSFDVAGTIVSQETMSETRSRRTALDKAEVSGDNSQRTLSTER